LVRPAPRAFFRPDRRFRTPARAEAVKVGRRSAIEAYSEVSRPRLDSFEHGGMLDRIGVEGGRRSGGSVSHSANEVADCRMFLCARCRSQVLVCSWCDRGQIYCFGTCALEARREHQREARRRYQATPRGRGMHAARNRRYRARGRCVTDQGPAKEQKAGHILELEVGEATGDDLNKPAYSGKSPLKWLCHNCRRSASEFVRLQPRLRRQDYLANKRRGGRGPLSPS